MTEAAAASNLPEWTVSELSGALRRTLEDAFGFVRVRGELGRVTRHASGHVYIDLKDEQACIAGVVWRQTALRLRTKLEQGLEVVVTGRITSFPAQSKYQIVVDTIEPAGVGALMALLEERRQRLLAEGLFDPARKRKPPFLPGIIGVVTSPSGAVIRDILHRLADRFPRRVLIWPVPVQGEACPRAVAAAIAGFNALLPDGPIPRPHLLIVARGGGSLEDLWGFNDESVVRAAAASAIPLISAIGHETDTTLIDHAADLRAPTPTGAAEMAVPVRSELVVTLDDRARRHRAAMLRAIERLRSELRSTLRGLPRPEDLFASQRQLLDVAAARLKPALAAGARRYERRFQAASLGLARRSPTARLAIERQKLQALQGRLLAGREAVVRAERVRLTRDRERVSGLAARARRGLGGHLERAAARLAGVSALLASLGYRSVLARGFTLVRDGDGRPVRSAAALSPGQGVAIEFADGTVRASIEGLRGKRRPPPPAAQGSLFEP